MCGAGRRRGRRSGQTLLVGRVSAAAGNALADLADKVVFLVLRAGRDRCLRE